MWPQAFMASSLVMPFFMWAATQLFWSGNSGKFTALISSTLIIFESPGIPRSSASPVFRLSLDASRRERDQNPRAYIRSLSDRLDAVIFLGRNVRPACRTYISSSSCHPRPQRSQARGGSTDNIRSMRSQDSFLLGRVLLRLRLTYTTTDPMTTAATTSPSKSELVLLTPVSPLAMLIGTVLG